MTKSGYRDFKWNISRSEGQILAYDSIKQILMESKNNLLELNELIVLINQRTKHLVIKNYTKRRNLINYLKINTIIFWFDCNKNYARTIIRLYGRDISFLQVQLFLMFFYDEWFLFSS